MRATKSRTLLTAAFVVGASLVVRAVPAQTSACPDPRTCGSYRLHEDRWATDGAGLVIIPFYVNPKNSWVNEDVAVEAILAAARTWTAANPALRLIYKGRTERSPWNPVGPFCVPARSGSETCIPERTDQTIIGWVPEIPGGSFGVAHAGPTPERKNGYVVRATMAFNDSVPWSWTPCRQRNGSCASITGANAWDIQNVATHEFGHWLSLGDLSKDQTHSELTMWSADGPGAQGQRKKSTLGLGDILGARALYPWRCPRPTQYGSYPPAYRSLCPRITVYVP